MSTKQPIRRYKRRGSGGSTALIVLLTVLALLALASLILAVTGHLDPLIDRLFGEPAVSEPAESDPEESESEPEESDPQDGSESQPESEPESSPESGSGDESNGESGGESEDGPGEDPTSWLSLDMSATEGGMLVLLNNDHPYTFPTISNLINVYTYQQEAGSQKHYSLYDVYRELNREAMVMLDRMLVDYTTAIDKNPVIWTAYRSFDDQQELYDRYNGVNCFKGGCTDYHTGNAVSIKLRERANDGNYYAYSLNSHSETYNWFKENAHKYGFVMRYPSDKKAYTGTLTDGEDHYRYVGVTHATAMYERGMCLEEYLLFIRDFTLMGNHLQTTTEEGTFEIYSVKLSEDGVTKVPVPAEGYTISGDNCGYVIVTVPVASEE